MAYQALNAFPGRQKKFLQLFSGHPGFQKYVHAQYEKNLILPYTPKHPKDLSTKARQLYNSFQKNNNQDLR